MTVFDELFLRKSSAQILIICILYRLQAELEEARRKVQEEMLEELELEKVMVNNFFRLLNQAFSNKLS